jgi:hypothetical protein
MFVFLRSIIILTAIFSLNACIGKNDEFSKFFDLLTNNDWHHTAFYSNQVGLNSFSNRTQTINFNKSGGFVIKNEFNSIPDDDIFTSEGEYFLGKAFTTEQGMTAFPIDLIYSNSEGDSILDIVYIHDNALYFGTPRKLDSCEDGVDTITNEPAYEIYDVAATDDIPPISDVSDLSSSLITHILGCYGRPNSLDFDKAFTKDMTAHQVINQKLKHNEWRSSEIIKNGELVTTYFSFLNDWLFSQTEYTLNANGSTTRASKNLMYTLGKTIHLESGHIAFELNLTPQTFMGFSENYLSLIRYDIVYIEDNTLYFGKPNIINTCEGEHYIKTNINIELANGQVITFEESTDCYTRPVAIDFDNPHKYVTPITIQ